MFDSIRIHTFINITDNLGAGTIFIDEDTGETNRTYNLDDSDCIPYLRYNETSGRLVLKVSIPKFIRGNNLFPVSEPEITIFWNKLDDYFYTRFNIKIGREEWVTEKIDVCQNLWTGNQCSVKYYIGQLQKKKLPYLKTNLYGHNQTVEFANSGRSRRIKFYDKKQQLIDTHAFENLINDAEGILRLEITPSYNDLCEYSHSRKAVDILSKHFFDYILDKCNKVGLLTIEPMEKPSVEFLKGLELKNMEKALSMMFLLENYNESEIKELLKYDTIKRRKYLVKEIYKGMKKGSHIEDLNRLFI